MKKKRLLILAVVAVIVIGLVFALWLRPGSGDPSKSWVRLNLAGLNETELPIENVALSGDGRFVAWGASVHAEGPGRGYVGIIELTSGKSVFDAKFPSSVNSVSLDNTGARIYVSRAGGGIRCFNISTGQQLWECQGTNTFFQCIVLPDGYILAHNMEVLVRLDPATGAVKAQRPFSRGLFAPSPIDNLGVSASSSPFVIESRNNSTTLLLLDPLTLATNQSINLPEPSTIDQPAVNADASQVFLIPSGDLVTLSDFITSAGVRTLQTKRRFFTLNPAPAFSNDGGQLQIVAHLLDAPSLDYQLLSFDTRSGDLVQSSPSLPHQFEIWSSIIDVQHGIVVAGGRFETSRTAALYWMKLPPSPAAPPRPLQQIPALSPPLNELP